MGNSFFEEVILVDLEMMFYVEILQKNGKGLMAWELLKSEDES
jgi:hypothetical protein